MKSGKTLQKLTLSKTTGEDLDTLYVFQTDPEGIRLAAFTAENPNDKAAYFDKYNRFLDDPTINMFTIRINHMIAGSIAKFIMQGDAEITYWISRQYWGQGVASEALKQFLTRELTRPLHARNASDNYGSQKVLERNGFRHIGSDHGYANGRQATIEEYIYILM